jgi:hypothetical protein
MWHSVALYKPTVCSLSGPLACSFEGCPESIKLFGISRKPVVWPWCNLEASQRRPYSATMKSHSLVGLVSRQWDAVDSYFVLCDRRVQNDRASRSASSRQWVCLFYSSRAGIFGKASHHPGLSALLQPRFGSLRILAFHKAKIAVEREEICECDGHTVHKLSQRRLTADWLAPRESGCSRMHSKVSFDRLPSHQGHATGSRDIQNGWILSGQPSYFVSHLPVLYKFQIPLTNISSYIYTSPRT